jgi:tetratricopeptide (TPR) repeat protein
MAPIGFTGRFRRLDRDYLMQTSLSEARKTIACSLFNSGKLINTRTFSLPPGLENGAVIDKVSEIHESCLADINALLGLVERMRELEKPDLIEKLGATLRARELYDEGCELLIFAVQKFPDNPGLHYALGKIYLGKKQYEEAREELSQAVILAPSFPDYRNILGITFLKLKKPVAAIDEFRKAVEINIYYDEAYFNLGLGYILNGIVKEDFNLAKNLLSNCQEAFQKASLFNPAFVTENCEKGMEQLSAGNLEQAYEILGQVGHDAVSHFADEKLLEMYMRCIHGQNGLTETGIKEYVDELRELLKSNPGHADLHNELGMAYTIMSKFLNNKAMEHFQEALRLNPNFAKASRNLKLSQNDLKGFEVLLEAIIR